MANVIEITLKASDKTKGVLGKVGSSLAGIGKTAIKGVAIGFAAAGTAAVAFGIKSIMAGADAEEKMSKLSATFGEASEGMITNLDAFAEATGRSRFELREAATDMGAVIKALGGTEEQAAAMSSSMTMLATDLGAFNNMPTAEVAHKIQSALTGEFESLKSLGVVINQAKLNQELLNMGVEGGTKAATDYQKALAVQNIIMEQTTDAQGTAEKETGSFTGQMVKLKSSLKDAAIEIGMKLLPVVTPLITKFAAFAADVLPKVVQWIGDNLPKAIETAKGIFNTLKPILETIWKVFGAIADAVSTVIGWIGSFIDKLKLIKLPKWLTPGSPTPFELGLRGISSALKDITGAGLPEFQAALPGGSPGGGVGGAAVGAAGMTFNFYDTVIGDEQDVRNLAYEVVELLKG